jgi:flagellar hook assembly protein FlgD
VRQLLNQPLDAGIHSVVWDGTDDRGTSLASGIYYYQLKAKGSSLTKVMNLVK